MLTCRNKHCDKSFSTSSNRSKHEKRSCHGEKSFLSAVNVMDGPLVVERGRLYKCRHCIYNSKKYYNVKRHMATLKCQNKTAKTDNKVCLICNKVFARKSNLKRHQANSCATRCRSVVNKSTVAISDEVSAYINSDLPTLVPHVITNIEKKDPETCQTGPLENECLTINISKVKNNHKKREFKKVKHLFYCKFFAETVLGNLKSHFACNTNMQASMTKSKSVRFLRENFKDQLHDSKFMKWLAKKLNCHELMLLQLISCSGTDSSTHFDIDGR